MDDKVILGYENNLISYVIQSSENFLNVKIHLEDSHFLSSANKAIYYCCNNIFQNKLTDSVYSITTIEIELNKNNYGCYVEYLRSLSKSSICYSIDDVNAIIEEVKDFHLRQKINAISSNIIKATGNPSHELTNIVSDAVQALVNTQVKETKETKEDVIKNVFKQIRSNIANKGKITGIDTGFRELNALTCGWQKTDLIILAARPSIGKTAFALNIMSNAIILDKQAGLFLSYEMGLEQLTIRIMSMLSGVDSMKIKTGNLTPEEISLLIIASKTIKDEGFYFSDESGTTAGNMRALIMSYILRDKIKFVVIDYLQLMRSGKNHTNTNDEISEITRELKLIAKDLKIPIILLSQLNRKVEERIDKRPVLSDLRQSGAIEQDADVIMFLYRDDYYNPHTTQPNITEVGIAKQRNGPLGVVPLNHHLALTKYTDVVRNVA